MIAYEKTANGIVELTVSGRVTKDEVTAACERMARDIEEAGTVRVLENVVGFEGIGLAAIWEDLRLALPLARKIDKVAVVADQGWIRAAVGVGRLFTSAEIRHFAPGEAAAARLWLAEA